MVIFFSHRVRSRTQYCIFLALLEFKLRKKEGEKEREEEKGRGIVQESKSKERRSVDE